MSESTTEWDVVLRPRLIPIVAYIAAFIVATAGITVGIFSTIKFTGAYIQPADQFAMGLLGIVLGAAILLLAMPRVRIGPAGIGVRNLLVERVVPWDEVVDVSFPRGRVGPGWTSPTSSTCPWWPSSRWTANELSRRWRPCARCWRPTGRTSPDPESHRHFGRAVVGELGEPEALVDRAGHVVVPRHP